MASSQDEARALELARKVEGVVEVRDELEIVRDVARRISPALRELGGWFDTFVAYLPLLLVGGLILALFAYLARLVGGLKRRSQEWRPTGSSPT